MLCLLKSTVFMLVRTLIIQLADNNNKHEFKITSMENLNGYKESKELKEKIQYCRMDDSMIARVKEIRRKTGISTSEIIREAVRRLLNEIDEIGSFNLKMN